MSVMFVPLCMRASVEVNGSFSPQPITVEFAKGTPGMLGVLPVFETREQALEWADGAEVLQIGRAEEPNDG